MKCSAPLLLLLTCCAPAEPEGPAPDALEALDQPVFEGRVAARIAEFEGLTAGTQPEVEQRIPEKGELPALVELFVSGPANLRELTLDDMASMGAEAVPELLALSGDESIEPAARNAALHLALGTRSPAGLAAVVQVLESALEPWRRREAAWLLGQTDDDRMLLRMLLVLRYEKDSETVVWLSQALAHHGNYAGLDALGGVATQGTDVAELARTKQSEIVANFEPAVPDAKALAELWSSAKSHEVFLREPSAELRLAAWRELAELSSERFQLRGVDDARFVLCRTGPWGARLVAEALLDADPFVRLHATQVLERMGARARPLAQKLHPLLRDPRTAHAVAEALGAIGAPESLPLLLAALDERHHYELRVAAAHGLARMRNDTAASQLRSLMQAEAVPSDLRLAAAGALLMCTDDRNAADLLVWGMEDELGDPLGCEVTLGKWIESSAESGVEGFETLNEEWKQLSGPAPLLRTPSDTQTRLAKRTELVRTFLR